MWSEVNLRILAVNNQSWHCVNRHSQIPSALEGRICEHTWQNDPNKICRCPCLGHQFARGNLKIPAKGEKNPGQTFHAVARLAHHDMCVWASSSHAFETDVSERSVWITDVQIYWTCCKSRSSCMFVAWATTVQHYDYIASSSCMKHAQAWIIFSRHFKVQLQATSVFVPSVHCHYRQVGNTASGWRLSKTQTQVSCLPGRRNDLRLAAAPETCFRSVLQCVFSLICSLKTWY